ncbi:MAG TPA: MarR family transcriptional regulator, partial [Capillimicrobium sp.]
LHERLAERGHPDLRPAHGYAFQTIGARGATGTRIAEALGITKQAAGQMVDELERLGYVRREPDPADARRKLVRLTDRGEDALRQSAAVFDELRDEWAAALDDPAALERLTATLRAGAGAFGGSDALRPVW